jgi:hypothetical protein
MLKSILKYNVGERVIILSNKRALKRDSDKQVDNAFGSSCEGRVLEIVDKLEQSYIGSNGKQKFQIFESDIVSKTLTIA